MRGRPSSLIVTLSPDDTALLQSWQRSQVLRVGLARRGRIILLRAAGKSITEIATLVGLHRRHVYVWLHRYNAQGIAGLRDAPGRGKKKVAV